MQGVAKRPDVRLVMDEQIKRLKEDIASLEWFRAGLPPIEEPLPERVESMLFQMLAAVQMRY